MLALVVVVGEGQLVGHALGIARGSAVAAGLALVDDAAETARRGRGARARTVIWTASRESRLVSLFEDFL